MVFRPKFCCNCGERIERIEWHLWTSRRFCELCATEYKHIDLVPIAAVGLGFLLSVLGLSSYFRGPDRVPVVSRNGEPRNTVRQLKSAPPASIASSNGVQPPQPVNAANVGNFDSTVQKNEQPVRTAPTSDNAVFYCGAITKKGTPCTRRVKVKGFCWQHSKPGQIAPTRF